MKTKAVHCPDCGELAAGKFCGHCGTRIMSTCRSCGATVKTGLDICDECESLASQSSASWNAQRIAPWAAIAIAMTALVISLLAWFDRRDSSVTPQPIAPSSSLPTPSGAPAVDLSSMSPREAADRLFNRVMAASENGNMSEALQFVPMALQAYDNLGTLDNDARYHVAMLYITANDIKNASVQVDALRKSAARHLLSYMLEQQIAERAGNKGSAAQQAYKAFLAAYDSEIAAGRPEYQEHLNSIESFRKMAQASGGKSAP